MIFCFSQSDHARQCHRRGPVTRLALTLCIFQMLIWTEALRDTTVPTQTYSALRVQSQTPNRHSEVSIRKKTSVTTMCRDRDAPFTRMHSCLSARRAKVTLRRLKSRRIVRLLECNGVLSTAA